MKNNDIAALDAAIAAANKANLGTDEGVKAGVAHLAFLHEERALVEELGKVRIIIPCDDHTIIRPTQRHAVACNWAVLLL